MTKQERYTALSVEIERCELELRGKRFLGVLTNYSDEKNYDDCLAEECFNHSENKPLTEDELTIIRGGNPYENQGETSVTEEELESAKIWYKENTRGDINEELTDEKLIQLALSLRSP